MSVKNQWTMIREVESQGQQRLTDSNFAVSDVLRDGHLLRAHHFPVPHFEEELNYDWTETPLRQRPLNDMEEYNQQNDWNKAQVVNTHAIINENKANHSLVTPVYVYNTRIPNNVTEESGVSQPVMALGDNCNGAKT